MEVVTAVLLASACATLAALAVRWNARRARRLSVPAVETPPEAAGTGEGQAATGPSARDQLEQICLQDIVLHDGMELTVAGVARYEERELAWSEVRVVDGEKERWLVVRPQDPDAVIVGERTAELGLGSEPSEALEHEGKVFQLERCGQAQVSGEGELGGDLADGEYRYWDYRRPGADRLWIRRGPQGTVSFAGQRVGRHLVCLLPGS
jgi:hypothetical protein